MAEPTFLHAGRHEIHSRPIFVVVSGERSDILVCEANMVVETGEPYENKSGRRQVDIRESDWVARGNSELLGGNVEFRLNPERQQESWVIAGENEDFPAQLRFGMDYNVRTSRGTLEGLTGFATGDIQSFPPKITDIFTIDKEVNIEDLILGGVACAC
jgi:hypothetical protein